MCGKLIVLVVIWTGAYAMSPKERVEDAAYWLNVGQENLRRVSDFTDGDVRKARNVIIFIGDGMGMATITASRIYKGQRDRKGSPGEEYAMSFEEFPNVALSKTYNVDKQVPDSAGTATALFSGVKTRYNMLGLDYTSHTDQYDGVTYDKSKLTTIMDWAQQNKMRTGFVTTTRVTHATPAALYAKVNHRDWECDSAIPKEYQGQVKDIARQLVEDAPGNKFNVILAGGGEMMGIHFPAGKDSVCPRNDQRDLVKDWLSSRPSLNKEGYFVNTTKGLLNAPVLDIDYLMGIFASNHLPFTAVRDKDVLGTPSLAEMTLQSLAVLTRPKGEGFVLMVEGGRIDHAHHENYAQLALQEAYEFDEAIKVALKETNTKETLIIVTADHSHAFTMNGYPKRGNDILGFGNKNNDYPPYETLSYANGPGYLYHRINDTNSNETWRNLSDNPLRDDPFYRRFAGINLDHETHGGEDVPVYAIGPCSNMVRGVFEQNYIAHVISYASCIGPSSNLNTACGTSGLNHCVRSQSATATQPRLSLHIPVLYLLLITTHILCTFIA